MQKTKGDRARIYKRAIGAEKDLAISLGMRTTPGSGNGFQKEDVVGSNTMIQVKTTAAASFSIKDEYLKTLKKHAERAGKTPALVVETKGFKYVVIPEPWDKIVLTFIERGEFDDYIPS